MFPCFYKHCVKFDMGKCDYSKGGIEEDWYVAVLLPNLCIIRKYFLTLIEALAIAYCYYLDVL